MVEVRSDTENTVLEDADGAFVNVVTWAQDLRHFAAKVNELMQYLNLRVVAVEDAEPLEERGILDQLDKEIRDIANEVLESPESIRYSTFHTWKS